MEQKQPVTAYLVDVVTRERLAFQYNPNDIVDSKATTYATLVVPGMSHPRYQYVAGDARKISFTASFYSGDVQQQVAWLQSLLYGVWIKLPGILSCKRTGWSIFSRQTRKSWQQAL